jgi:hypothetical protein
MAQGILVIGIVWCGGAQARGLDHSGGGISQNFSGSQQTALHFSVMLGLSLALDGLDELSGGSAQDPRLAHHFARVSRHGHQPVGGHHDGFDRILVNIFTSSLIGGKSEKKTKISAVEKLI